MKQRVEVEILARAVCVSGGCVLVCRTRGARHTYLPGGHVEFGESAPAALARELREELGRWAKVGRFLGVVEHTFRQRGRRRCEVNLVFAARVAGLRAGRPVSSREGWLSFGWAPRGDLAGARLEPAVLRRLLPAWLRARERGPGWGTTYR